MSKGAVISFINMKGGVGKTTCAVNIAAYLAREHKKRVLLVDLDPQTNASLSVMTEKRWNKWQEDNGTMADILEVDSKRRGGDGVKLKDCIIHDVLDEIPGLDLIPSHLKLTFLDLDLAARPGRERIFTRKLEKVKSDYDIILCDCAPNLMTGTQNALYASDSFFIPMQPDFLSSIGLELLLDRLAYLRKSLEFKISCFGAAFARVRAPPALPPGDHDPAPGLRRASSASIFRHDHPGEHQAGRGADGIAPHRPARRLRHGRGSISKPDG